MNTACSMYRCDNNEATSLDNGPLTKEEGLSVSALVAYVAYKQKISEETVKAILLAVFGGTSVCHIDRRHYDNVVRFLVDFQFKKSIN